MSLEIIAAIVGALVSGLLIGIITWSITKSTLNKENNRLHGQLTTQDNQLITAGQNIEELQSNLNLVQQSNHKLSGDVNRLLNVETKYKEVKRKLQASSVVREYLQPVILAGPQFVGKTSLLAQWHTPWDHSRLVTTPTHKVTTVPIYDFKRENTEPHFADPEILTDVHVHLKLRVHDFPGKINAQESIMEQAEQETTYLRKSTGKSLGIVLICMFDAAKQELGQEMIDYYNGDLFKNLRQFVAYNRVGIERLVLVFNKYDLLKKQLPNQDDVALRRQCIEVYKPIITLFRGTCSSEKECEVFTILGREEMEYKNQGAPIVMGEAARRFVEAMAGAQVAQEVIGEGGSNLAAPML